MPLVMMVKSSDCGHAGDEGLDGEGRFGLAHEDAGSDVEGFGAAGSHDLLHDDGHALDDHCMTPR